MKHFHLVSILFLIVLSCQSNKSQDETQEGIIRPVYHPYSLGMPIMEAVRHDMIYQLAAKNAKPENLPGVNRTLLGKTYYARPIIVAEDYDTVLRGLKVFFTIKPEDLKDVTKREIMFPMEMGTKIIDTEIRDEVIDNVSKKYGSPDRKDTVSNGHEAGLHIRYSWLNRKDVDITLDYKAVNRIILDDFVYYYSIVLNYSYTKDLLKKTEFLNSKY
jgi:hypothetical protein